LSAEEFRKQFANRLQFYMESNGKKQIDLANDLGFTRSAISTWCNGTRIPGMDKIDILVEYLGIKRSDLLEDKADIDGAKKEFQLKDTYFSFAKEMQEKNISASDMEKIWKLYEILDNTK